MRKFYSCYFMNSGLHFTPDKMRFCCAPTIGPHINTAEPTEDIFQELVKLRNENIELMKNHIIPKLCEGCLYIKEYDLDDTNISQEIKDSYYDNNKHLICNIIMNHFKQCDCRCIYCSQDNFLSKMTNIPQKSAYYSLLPIIQNFYKENLIDKEKLHIEFQGGSIAVLDEFHDLVEEYITNGVRSIQFFTNGIKYLPEIVEASKKAECMVICSLDAGQPETFRKMKSVDKFYDVVSNLRRYKEENSKIIVNAKYILIEGKNDNLDELSKFLDVVAQAKIGMVQLDMDFHKVMIYKGVRYDVPKHYYELYDFYKKRSEELGLYPFVWEYIQSILDQGYFI